MHNSIPYFPCGASTASNNGNGVMLYCSHEFGHDDPCAFVIDTRSFNGDTFQNSMRPTHDAYTEPTKTYYGYEWPYDEYAQEKKMDDNTNLVGALGIAAVFAILLAVQWFRSKQQ